MAEQAKSPQTGDQTAPSAAKKERLSGQALADRQQKDADDAAKKRSEIINRHVIGLVKELESYSDAQRDEILRDISSRVGSIRTVATAAMLRTSRSTVQGLEAEHAPFLTPAAAEGDDKIRNITAQREHLEGEAKK